jgi:hypothetical protein
LRVARSSILKANFELKARSSMIFAEDNLEHGGILKQLRDSRCGICHTKKVAREYQASGGVRDGHSRKPTKQPL